MQSTELNYLEKLAPPDNDSATIGQDNGRKKDLDLLHENLRGKDGDF